MFAIRTAKNSLNSNNSDMKTMEGGGGARKINICGKL